MSRADTALIRHHRLRRRDAAWLREIFEASQRGIMSNPFDQPIFTEALRRLFAPAAVPAPGDLPEALRLLIADADDQVAALKRGAPSAV